MPRNQLLSLLLETWRMASRPEHDTFITSHRCPRQNPRYLPKPSRRDQFDKNCALTSKDQTYHHHYFQGRYSWCKVSACYRSVGQKLTQRKDAKGFPHERQKGSSNNNNRSLPWVSTICMALEGYRSSSRGVSSPALRQTRPKSTSVPRTQLEMLRRDAESEPDHLHQSRSQPSYY